MRPREKERGQREGKRGTGPCTSAYTEFYSSRAHRYKQERKEPGGGRGPFHRKLRRRRRRDIVQEAAHACRCRALALAFLENVLLRRQADQQAPVHERHAAGAGAVDISGCPRLAEDRIGAGSLGKQQPTLLQVRVHGPCFFWNQKTGAGGRAGAEGVVTRSDAVLRYLPSACLPLPPLGGMSQAAYLGSAECARYGVSIATSALFTRS